MSDSSRECEFTDGATGTRLTIEHDIPRWPRITVYPPEPNNLEVEEFHEALDRLLQSAGLKPKPVRHVCPLCGYEEPGE